MFKRSVIIATLVISLAACKSKSKSAHNYSQNIVTIERTLEPEVQRIENNVKRYYPAGQYDSIAIAGENMEKLVQKKIDEINALRVPDAKEAGNFKTAVMGYFKFIKSLYTAYKEFGLSGTEEERQEKLEDIQKIVSLRSENLALMQNAQRKYAEANGFRIENKTY